MSFPDGFNANYFTETAADVAESDDFLTATDAGRIIRAHLAFIATQMDRARAAGFDAKAIPEIDGSAVEAALIGNGVDTVEIKYNRDASASARALRALRS